MKKKSKKKSTKPDAVPQAKPTEAEIAAANKAALELLAADEEAKKIKVTRQAAEAEKKAKQKEEKRAAWAAAEAQRQEEARKLAEAAAKAEQERIAGAEAKKQEEAKKLAEEKSAQEALAAEIAAKEQASQAAAAKTVPMDAPAPPMPIAPRSIIPGTKLTSPSRNYAVEFLKGDAAAISISCTQEVFFIPVCELLGDGELSIATLLASRREHGPSEFLERQTLLDGVIVQAIEQARDAVRAEFRK